MAKSTKHSFEPSSAEQVAAVSAIESNPITFLVGDPGTGKTYIAAALATKMLSKGTYSHVIVGRPAVEAGEKLGSLPGTYQEKIDPFQSPVIDLLKEFILQEPALKGKADDLIEKHAVAYMRGRTFNTIVIIDEAQNLKVDQMKMILTRLGKEGRLIITGDPKQCDLPPKEKCGLEDAIKRLDGVPGIAVVHLTAQVSNNRHPLVQTICTKYER